MSSQVYNSTCLLVAFAFIKNMFASLEPVGELIFAIFV